MPGGFQRIRELPPEKREAIRNARQWFRSLPPEERHEMRQRWKNMSPEEREAFRRQLRQRDRSLQNRPVRPAIDPRRSVCAVA
ncbi:DUF3106 domain-containing protein [Nitrospira sp. NS4]|uniref:DUF3106 domain-containing protein n=1 Tax=Nitrospira sp. NS4 TaxID=3414498 RepID=UPI003C2FB2D2